MYRSRQIISDDIIVVMVEQLPQVLQKYSFAAIALSMLKRILTAFVRVATIPYGRIYRRNTLDHLVSILGGNPLGKRDDESRYRDEGAQLERLQKWIKTKEREAGYVQVAVWKTTTISKLTIVFGV